MFSLHAQHYTDPKYFSQEQSLIFASSWIPIAHKSELHSTKYALERKLLDHSILIVRNENSIGAFHNICRHRAGPLLWKGECTPIKALRCKYHGWRYHMDGSLSHAPDFGVQIDSKDHSLYSIHL